MTTNILATLRSALAGVSRSLILLAALASGGMAQAQYPQNPIKLIAPFPPGGITDAFARIVAQQITQQSGKVLVVDNRSGAGGRIGYEAGARSPADGYTFVVTDPGYTMLPALYEKLPFATTDLVPVTMVGLTPMMLVGNPAKVSNFADFAARAKANPGALSYGSSGAGSIVHVVGEMLNRTGGLHLLHVPYRGGGESLNGLLGGSVDSIVTAVTTIMGQIQAGKAVGLVVTSTKRVPGLPNVPTATEMGVPVVAYNWIGLSAPKGTPRAAIDWMQSQVAQALANPNVRKQLADRGGEIQIMTTEEFAKFVDDEGRRWAGVIRDAKIKAE